MAEGEGETREVLVHLNVDVPAELDNEAAKAYAVDLAIGLARDDAPAFEALIALVDPI